MKDLTSQIKADRKLKRKKFQINPNTAFADVEAIRKAQIDARAISPNSDDLEDSSTLTEEGLVIVVAGN